MNTISLVQSSKNSRFWWWWCWALPGWCSPAVPQGTPAFAGMCSKQVWEKANFSGSTVLSGQIFLQLQGNIMLKRSSFLITSMIKDFNPGWFGLSFIAKPGKTPWKTDTRRGVTLWVWQLSYQQHSLGSLHTSWTFLSPSFTSWIKITKHPGERKLMEVGMSLTEILNLLPHGSADISTS